MRKKKFHIKENFIKGHICNFILLKNFQNMWIINSQASVG